MSGSGRLLVMLAAVAAAIVPVPPASVERLYSTGVYPPLQRTLTAISNLTPFALLDVLLIVVAAGWLALTVRDVFDLRQRGWGWTLGRGVLRTAHVAALAYLAFLAAWGLNYRRVPITERVQFDEHRVTQEAALDLARLAAAELNRLHTYADRDRPEAAIAAGLEPAFAEAQRALGITSEARSARPKPTLLDPYFVAAGVDGMTDPFFLETLVSSSLLPIERAFVVAHEWSHLAGVADEGEANLLGWLTCLQGDNGARYSGWLFLYREVVAGLEGRDRADIAALLGPGPHADLRAIAQRLQTHVNPAVSAAGWRVYDTYLKANRVESGAGSYAEVVKLVLGLRGGLIPAASRP